MSPIMVNVRDNRTLKLVNILFITTTKKQVKPKNSFVADHLLFCNYSAFYDDFSILKREYKKLFARIEREPVNNEK